ncbi:tRNA (N6-threonylcarbamoyladenosine(37)-N6)-methyltransferase TrmO [archaeon RBG_16_50_20]|nr:MAG: tRNA (N6-threonylcarbamoyladenosine(37)-N6)-methyltransferase TrmO [archaeon RBG_16_50_20]
MPTENHFTFRQVGVVRTKATDDEVKEMSGQMEATVEIFPEFQEALDGLDGFSHIFVLSYLHKLRPEQIGPLKVRPRRFLRAGLKPEEVPLVGVFSIESPTRPNPIGLSLVKLVRREGRMLHVEGLDVFNGTPVLDIKPYTETYMVEQYELAEWNRQLLEKMENTSS